MQLPKTFVELEKIFAEHSFSLYMVGGTARDFLLGKELVDYDFATDATLDEISSFIKIKDSFKDVGSTSIIFNNEKVDITTFRKEGEYLDHRHPSSVIYCKTIKEDYSRRDFTINAIYISSTGAIIDYPQGQKDLESKIIKMIGDPSKRLKEDPLRILRAIRFAATLGFEIDEELSKSIEENRYLLREISYSKCVKEIKKMRMMNLKASNKFLEKYKIEDSIPLDFDMGRNKLRTIDLHCDTITCLENIKGSLYKNELQLDLLKMAKGEYSMQCFAIFINIAKCSSPYKRFLEYYSYYKKQIEENSFIIKEARNYNEYIENREKGKMSSLLTIEDADIMEGKIERINELYNFGVRMMSLTWNYKNSFGEPNVKYTFEGASLSSFNEEGGLTLLGIELVKRMNELGIIIDVSHLSDKGFYDVLKYTTSPICASHSNSRSVQNVCRNLNDDQIRLIKENGGVIGINYCPLFISNDENDEIDGIVRHIKHIVSVGGINCVSLGSDFDGIHAPPELNDCSKVSLIKEALIKEGFSLKDIKKIFYENFLRVFKKVCK